MNKIFFLLGLMLFGLSGVIFAQQPSESASISGIILDEAKEPMEQVTVRLLQLPDSTFKEGVFTDKEGVFSLKNVTRGNYVIQVSYLGYNTFYKPVRMANAEIKIPDIQLSPDSRMLKEAVVIGHVADVIVKQDTIEYNADSYKLPPGSMTEDLLKKLPGVEVDTDGKITVAGKQITKIYVDGKEFFGNDPKVTTKNLPTNIINKLQVVDRKSELAQLTGIDDGEEEKIINITIKPGMNNGWFGNAIAGGGTQVNDKNRYELSGMISRFSDKTRISLIGNANNTNNQASSDFSGDLIPQMNARGRGRRQESFSGSNGITQSGTMGLNINNTFSKKLSASGSVVYGNSDAESYSSSQRQNMLSDSVFYTNDTTRNRNISNNLAADFRFDYKPDSLTQISFRPRATYNDSNTDEIGYTETRDGSPLQALVNQSNSGTSTNGTGYSISGTLDISRQSRTKKGRRFTISLTGGITNGDSDGKNDSQTDYFDAKTGLLEKTDIIDQIQNNVTRGYNYRLYASYVEPVFTNRFLQLSYSVRVSDNDSKKNTFTRDSVTNEYTVLDTAYSRGVHNSFINQQISMSLRTVRENYDYSLGLDISPSTSKSDRYIGDDFDRSLPTRSVVNFAPVASITYRFTRQRNLRFEYRGQTTQPSITQLDPTIDLSNPLNIRSGNPELDPSFTHRVYLRFNDYNREKQQSLMINGSFNYILDNIVNVSKYDTAGVRFTRPENINKDTWNARLQAFYNTPLKNPKFRINSNFTTSYNNTPAYVNGEENTSRVFGLSEIAGVSFRSNLIDIGSRFTIRYNNTSNTLEGQKGQATTDYGIGGNFSLNLPYNFVLASDINYTGRSGYQTGYSQNEALWNAEVSTRFLKNNQGTIKFKIYDILKDRKNIFRTISSDGSITDSQYNSLTSYCMLYFVYSFNSFGKGNSSSGRGNRDRSGGGGGRWGGGGPPPMDSF